MFNLLKKLLATVSRKIRMFRYNDFTIAEHFRSLGAQIGENSRIEIREFGPEPYLIKIGNHCTIAQNVAFLVHDGATWVFTEEIPSLQKFGPIHILDNCFIGYNAVIMGNVTIGPNSVVGAGSIVTRSIPANVVAAGNPARVICTIDEYKEKVKRTWEEQKPPGYFNGMEEGVKYTPQYIQSIKTRDSRILKEHLLALFGKKSG